MPPPAAPPFIPKQGPKLGSLKQIIAFLPMLQSPSTKPTLVVVFPSPAGVGEIAVTRISLPSSFLDKDFTRLCVSLALSSPNLIKSFFCIPIDSAISSIGFL